jgi:hypothetical protein
MPTFPFIELITSFAKYAIIGVLAGLTAWLCKATTSHISSVFQLGISIVTSGAVYLGLLYLVEQDTALSIFEITGIPRIYSAIKGRIHPITQTTHL